MKTRIKEIIFKKNINISCLSKQLKGGFSFQEHFQILFNGEKSKVFQYHPLPIRFAQITHCYSYGVRREEGGAGLLTGLLLGTIQHLEVGWAMGGRGLQCFFILILHVRFQLAYPLVVREAFFCVLLAVYKKWRFQFGVFYRFQEVDVFYWLSFHGFKNSRFIFVFFFQQLTFFSSQVLIFCVYQQFF